MTNATQGDPKSLLDRFKDAAHELERGNDPDRFRERLGKLVKYKPVTMPSEPKSPGRGK